MKETKETKEKPILHLNLIKKWFDIIGEEKKEEYRAMSEHWSKVFQNGKIKIKGKFYHPTDVVVCFSNGYSKNRPQKKFKLKGLKVWIGKEEWGAEKDVQYFVLSIGDTI